MKIGVALSGCGIGDLTIYCALSQMKQNGIDISHVSASQGLVAPALLFASGCPEEQALMVLRQKYMGEESAFPFLFRFGWKRRLLHLIFRQGIHTLAECPTAVSIVTEDRAREYMTAFSSLEGEREIEKEKWACFLEQEQDVRRVVQALCPAFGKSRYGDPTYRVGYPTYPLKFDGVDRMLCIGFTPYAPKNELERQNEIMCGAMRQIIRNDSHAQLCFSQPAPEKDRTRRMQELEKLGRDTVDDELLSLYDAVLF
ncbi:hypothetical protein [Zongyangia hominis]|uniref:Uncharacterized protein n=1 Tax=Zongyangia hominis TaxID=2763677 RepID=A0A926E9S2_9FIRM|nr:hypothetical protein [Zongyangia hominis]MBC8569818.1 hypothetical protein [Zongyangia hominis]